MPMRVAVSRGNSWYAKRSITSIRPRQAGCPPRVARSIPTPPARHSPACGQLLFELANCCAASNDAAAIGAKCNPLALVLHQFGVRNPGAIVAILLRDHAVSPGQGIQHARPCLNVARLAACVNALRGGHGSRPQVEIAPLTMRATGQTISA
jgi:hypothetical protein